jgi:hypothetical protein
MSATKWIILPVLFLYLCAAPLAQQAESVQPQCDQLMKENNQDAHWNPDGGWELRREWGVYSATQSVMLKRLATFKSGGVPTDDRMERHDFPEVRITCTGRKPIVEFTFWEPVTIIRGTIDVVLAWDGAASQLETNWTGNGYWAWPGSLSGRPGDDELHAGLARRLFSVSRLAICTRNNKGVPIVEKFDLDKIKERGEEVRRECALE